MTTSSARMIVRVPFVPLASIYMVVRVGTFTTAAPRRGLPLITEPFVYIQLSEIYLGVHWCGIGRVFGVRGNLVLPT